MTKNELSQLFYIKREIERNERKLNDLKTKLHNITQEISDMPKSQNVSDKISDYISKIVDLERLLAADEERKIDEERRLTEFIINIDDSRTRLIFTLRFSEGLKWREVAKYVSPHETADSARMTCERYLKTRSFCSVKM